jgi:hypothetical protein
VARPPAPGTAALREASVQAPHPQPFQLPRRTVPDPLPHLCWRCQTPAVSQATAPPGRTCQGFSGGCSMCTPRPPLRTAQLSGRRHLNGHLLSLRRGGRFAGLRPIEAVRRAGRLSALQGRSGCERQDPEERPVLARSPAPPRGSSQPGVRHHRTVASFPARCRPCGAPRLYQAAAPRAALPALPADVPTDVTRLGDGRALRLPATCPT